MKPFTLLTYSVLAMLTLFSLACHKDTTTNYVRYPLHLQATRTPEGVRLEWNILPSASDFVHYRIWRSNTSDTIPDNLEVITEPNGISNIVDVDSTLKIFDNVAFDRLKDLSFLKNNQTEVYYRVEAVLKNRSVLSPNIKIKAYNGLLIPSSGKEVQAIANATKNLLYLFSEDKVDVFDSKSETFIKTVALPSTFVFSNAYTLLLGNENGEEVIYVGNGTELSVLKASDLSEIETISFANWFIGDITHISTDEKGLFYISSTGINGNGALGTLYTLDRNANNAIIQYTNISSNGSNWVYEYSPIAKKIIGLKYNTTAGVQRIAYMNISAVAQTVSYDASLTLAFLQNSFTLPPFRFLLYDDGRFIVDKIGLRFDANISQTEWVFSSNLSQQTFVGQKYLDAYFLFVAPNALTAGAGGENQPTVLKKLAITPQDIFWLNGKIWLITNVRLTFGENVSFMEQVSF